MLAFRSIDVLMISKSGGICGGHLEMFPPSKNTRPRGIQMPMM